MQIHRTQLRTDKTIVLGDINSNTIWDKPDRWWNHSDVVEELGAIGLQSVYHAQTSEAQGKESTPTFFHHRNVDKAYHIDYVFASSDLLNQASVKIGSAKHWLDMSDHMPVSLELPIDASTQ